MTADAAPCPSGRRHVVAIDWGTSSLRAALMAPDGAILDRIETGDGIMFADGRSFEEIFRALFSPWLAAHPDALVLASGMIGSRQGWVEAPYADCPAGFDDLAKAIAFVEIEGLPRIGFVPGLAFEHASGSPDVMRGEEVQIFGALARLGLSDGVFVLPGTHSKWVAVEGGRVARFHTFFTGELFGVLKSHSILGRLMPDGAPQAGADAAFDAGCRVSAEGGGGGLLHHLFSVRTRGLFGRTAPEYLGTYLSGLLIGEEIREALSLEDEPPARVHLVCRGDLAELYRRGLAAFGVEGAAVDPAATFAGLHALAGRISQPQEA